MGEDIERLFYSDVREKKIAGYGASHKASTRKGFRGAVRTPYDFMSRSEKAKLNGEVVSYSMYEQVLKIDEFKALTPEQRTNALKVWIESHARVDLAKELGITVTTLDYHLAKAGLKEFTPSRKPKVEAPVVKHEEPAIKESGFKISLEGIFDSAEAVKRLESVGMVLAENGRYVIRLSVVEVE
jgi:hypothetical protein